MEKQFPNAQLSRPIPGNESLRFLNFRGEALGSRGDVLVFSPPAIESLHRVPLLLLLHGVYGCQWNWWLNADLNTIAMEMLRDGSMISRAACGSCFRKCICKNFFSRGSRWAATELCA